MAISAQEKLQLKRLIKELHSYKAPHTEFVTVYVPAGYDMIKIIQHLAEEQGTASNIKSASTRKNVQNALERMIQHLRTVGRTPENGLAVCQRKMFQAPRNNKTQIFLITLSTSNKLSTNNLCSNFCRTILQSILFMKSMEALIFWPK